MITIGLCGGSGSGKGAVSAIAREMNIPAIDTDSVYRALTSTASPCLDELATEFGARVISADGSLDRAVLREIVFNDRARLDVLNEITHKHILSRTREMLLDFSNSGYTAAIVDAPLLFESGFDKECDVVVCVIADKETRIARIVARDGIAPEAAEKRIASQLSDSELISASNFLIYNNGTVAELRANTEFVFKKIIDKRTVNENE